MKLRDPIRSILKHKGGNVWTVPPSTSVYDAIAMMGEKQVGALLVTENAKLAGSSLSAITPARSFSKGDPQRTRTVPIEGRAGGIPEVEETDALARQSP